MIPSGLTLDAGALIAIERRSAWMDFVLGEAIEDGRSVTIPAAALAEAWRDRRSWPLAHLLASGVVVEPLTEQLAKRAGELVGRVDGATTIDATVAVSAAQRADTVITSDPGDLQRLADDLRSIRVWGLTDD